MKYLPALLFLLLFSFTSCQKKMSSGSGSIHNQLTKAEKAAGWQLLFDGTSTKGWHVFNKQGTAGWEVTNGELIALGTNNNDIITDKQFKNFELSLEWKISPQGNSGIFFNVVEADEYNVVYATGPEYQLLDDEGYPNPLKDAQYSGANYDMHPPAKRMVKPVGEFNTSKIIVNDGHVEHWLNGEKVVEYQLWTPEWNTKVQGSKWKDFPGYGKAKEGHIALQDHGNKIWFRNIKIRPL
jgi:hypothetical protein